MALWLPAAPTHAADARRLDVRTRGLSLRLVLQATSTPEATTVAVRGYARIRAPRVTLSLLRCADARCSRPRPAARAVRRLPRGVHTVRVALHSARAPFVRVEVRSGQRRVGAATLRTAPPAAAPAVPAPAPSAPAPSAPAVTTPPPVALRTDPPLRPAFDPATPDYTVECEPGSQVDLVASVPEGRSLAVDGGPARTGAVSEDVPLRADQAFRFRTKGESGSQTYSVRCVPADFPGWSVQRDGDPQVGGLVFTAAHGSARFAVVADAEGVPVWWRSVVAGGLLDTKLLPDGTMVIGRSTGASFSTASFDHLRLDGTDLGSLQGTGAGVDTHDIQQLPNGDYLVLAYAPRQHADLSSIGGPSDAEVLDGELQEVTPAGEEVWRWSSKDHINVAESGEWPLAGLQTTYDGRPVYDLVHLNSAEQDGDAIVLSARHLDAVYRIRRSDGGIGWKLGGTHRPESLAFVGDPIGSANFGGQHDARVLPDGTLTVHENGAQQSRPPRAVRYRVDPLTGTATWLEQVTDSRVPSTFCCGSARRLPGGDWVMSWGSTPVITELTPAGEPVLTLRLDNGFSYRAQPLLPAQFDRAALRDGMDAMHPR